MTATEKTVLAPGRAAALPPEERRSTIVAAALPLLVAHGEAVTTKQIADAAGIAEGTIFRVFPDKDSVIRAVIEAVFDNQPLEQALDLIDRDRPLAEVLEDGIALLQERVVSIWRVASSVGPRFHDSTRRSLIVSPWLEAVLTPYRKEFSLKPADAARVLQSLTLALTHPNLAEKPMTPAQIVGLFLNGAAGRCLMLIKLLRTKLRPYKGQIYLCILLQAVQTTAALLLPTLNARIIDDGVLPGNLGFIRSEGALMLGVTLVQGAFAAAAVFVGARVAMSFGRDVRAALFHQVTEFSAREVGTFGAPSLITRITNDVQQVQLLVVMVGTFALGAPITMVVGIVMAVRQDVGLSTILLVAVPVAGVLLGSVVYRMIPAFQVMQERIDQINRVLREQVTGLRVVRAFVREPLEKERFNEANTDLTTVALRAGRLMSTMFPTVNVLINVSSVAVLWVGADRVATGDLQVGSLVAYLSYLVQVLFSVMMATFMVSMIPRASVSSDRIQEVLDAESSVVRPTDPVRELRARGELEFVDVSFSYPGAEQPVLDGISFTTRPGRITAVVGSTGAGKTTLVSLVPRLFDATAGSVLVGGVDVRELDPDVLWHSMGLVPQKPYLFTGTVASNLQYGKPDATEAEMWEALEVAQAADFVKAMPGGLEARIEQGGTNVSGGQRQRLSIARALVRKPDIYLFDDSFSALDLTTDARLRAALVPYTRDAAVVIVAQRVSTISTADEIVVLDDGHLVGIGTHDELIATCPTYAEIVESQIGAEDAA